MLGRHDVLVYKKINWEVEGMIMLCTTMVQLFERRVGLVGGYPRSHDPPVRVNIFALFKCKFLAAELFPK
jgi:hypothetical protein